MTGGNCFLFLLPKETSKKNIPPGRRDIFRSRKVVSLPAPKQQKKRQEAQEGRFRDLPVNYHLQVPQDRFRRSVDRPGGLAVAARGHVSAGGRTRHAVRVRELVVLADQKELRQFKLAVFLRAFQSGFGDRNEG